MVAAALFALAAAAFPATGRAQCWWTGFNYGCGAPAPFGHPYRPLYQYPYGWEPLGWWQFGFAHDGY
jgi:hypothetical protein